MEMWVIEQIIKYRHFLIPCNRKSFGALRICSSITETAFCPDLWVRTKKKRPMALERWAPCRGRWLWAGSSPPQLSPSCWDGSLPGHAHSMGGEWTWGQWHKETTKAAGRCWLPSTYSQKFHFDSQLLAENLRGSFCWLYPTLPKPDSLNNAF